MSDDRRTNFSALDPTLDHAAFDAEMNALLAVIVARRHARAAAVSRGELLEQIGMWFRPAVGLAVPVASVAALVLLAIGRRTRDGATGVATLIPSPVAEWFAADAPPPPLELLAEIDRAGDPRRVPRP